MVEFNTLLNLAKSLVDAHPEGLRDGVVYAPKKEARKVLQQIKVEAQKLRDGIQDLK